MVPQADSPTGAGADALWTKLLAEKDDGARRSIAWALRRKGVSSSPKLTEAARSKVEGVRELAMWLAGGLPWTASAGLLRAGVTDGSGRVRQAALVAACSYKTDAAVELVAAAARSPEAETAGTAALMLRSFGDRGLPALIDLATDARARGRAAALKVLAAMAPRGNPKALAAALAALASPEPDVRDGACRLVGAVGGRAQAAALRPLKQDPDERVRRHAEAAIADLEASQA